MKTMVALITLLGMAVASLPAHAQTQTAATIDDDISRICADYFPKGARYVGVMQIKFGGDGKMVPAEVMMDVNGCSRARFDNGAPAIKIDADWTVNGKTQPGISRYFGVSGQTLRWKASSNSTSTHRQTVISLAFDKMSYVEERSYDAYNNSTTMKRVPK